MFDIGWTEMLVVAIITILFVGPRELPGMLRTFGSVMKSLRSMASDLQSQFRDALRQSELDELKQIMDDPVSIAPTEEKDSKPVPQTPEEIEAQIAEDYAKAREVAVSNKSHSGLNAVPGFTSIDESESESADESKKESKTA